MKTRARVGGRIPPSPPPLHHGAGRGGGMEVGGRDLGEVERLWGGIEWGGVGGIGSERGELIEVGSDADDIEGGGRMLGEKGSG